MYTTKARQSSKDQCPLCTVKKIRYSFMSFVLNDVLISSYNRVLFLTSWSCYKGNIALQKLGS